MAETMTALEALQRYAEAAPDGEIAMWWLSMDSVQRKGWVRLMEEPANGDTTPEWSLVRRRETLAIIVAVRALSVREEQVRRDALVEGARWGLKEARAMATLTRCIMRPGSYCAHDRCTTIDRCDSAIAAIDPAAILEREKGKK